MTLYVSVIKTENKKNIQENLKERKQAKIHIYRQRHMLAYKNTAFNGIFEIENGNKKERM